MGNGSNQYRKIPGPGSISRLSGGQRQRVWIAMALAQNTKILFLDEPTTYLDIRYQIEILKLVRKLNREYGITIIMVLHDINQAIHYSDRIIGLKDGHVAAEGAPEEIITPEMHPGTVWNYAWSDGDRRRKICTYRMRYTAGGRRLLREMQKYHFCRSRPPVLRDAEKGG